MEDNQYTNNKDRGEQNPYPNFEPEQQTQEESYAQYVQNNDLNQPLIVDENTSNNEELTNRFLEIIKYTNIVSALYVSVVGLFYVFSLKLWIHDIDFLQAFFNMLYPFFYILFGIVLVLAEYYKQEINLYARFVRSYLGRGIFNIFLATQCDFGYRSWQQPGRFFAWILNILGLIYIFMHFIQTKINSEVKKKLME